jgi:hypothetical protein
MNITHSNLFILFAPGLGGNHIANLLSTSNDFVSRFNSCDYNVDDKNAHHYCVQNITPTDIKNNIDKLMNQSNVLCGHWASYHWFLQEGFGDYFPNRQILIIEPPSVGSDAYERLTQHTNAYSNNYFYEEMRLLYTIDTMQKMFNETDFFVLNAELIFQTKINTFIEKVEKELCISVDVPLCNDVHKTWFTNISRENNVKTN